MIDSFSEVANGDEGGLCDIDRRVEVLDTLFGTALVPNSAMVKVIRSKGTYDGKQGLTYGDGISRETCGSEGVCLHTLRIPPGGRANAHYHDGHESAIFLVSGQAEQLWGDKLENHDKVSPGDYVYIPSGVPHVVWNPSTTEDAVAVIARTDPSEQETVVLTPELEEVVNRFLAGA